MIIQPKRFLVFLFMFLFTFSMAQEERTRVSWDGGDLCADGEWKLVFQDEFEENQLDTSVWYTFYPYGDKQGNGIDCRVRKREDQIYLDENVLVEDGLLKLITKDEKTHFLDATRNHSSGMIHSKMEFKDYGKFEIRCKIPKGMGFWSAFWLFGWTTEIDVFEFGGHKTRTWHANIIMWGKDRWIGHSKRKIRGMNYAKEFHVYSCEYDPNFVRFFLDGKEKFKVSRLQDERGKDLELCHADSGEYFRNKAFPQAISPLSIIVNTAVAFDNGSFTNDPNNRTKFPGVFEVDYIRVYQRQ